MRTLLAALLLAACGSPKLTIAERAEIACDRFQECDPDTGSGGHKWCVESLKASPPTTACALAISDAECPGLRAGDLPEECTR